MNHHSLPFLFASAATPIRLLCSLLVVLSLAFARGEVTSPAVRSPAVPAHRVALVVGNAAYRLAPLRNPTHDAADFAASLKELGFIVTEAFNIESRAELAQLLENWGKSIRPDGVALFFYSGHGSQESGSNYLIPTKARVLNAADLRTQALPLDHVMAVMNSPDNHLNILVIDACRSPLTRELEKGLAPVVGVRGTFIAYATAPGSVALDGRDRNGLFTKHLLQHVKTPNIPIEDVFRRVRCAVLEDPENTTAQMPWDASSLTAGFSFAPAVERMKTDKGSGGKPVITFTKVPPFSKGGNQDWVEIAGRVSGADSDRHRIFLYSKTNKFHFQPVIGGRGTPIAADGRWEERIHGGEEYIAIVAPREFEPRSPIEELPQAKDGVLAEERVPKK